MMQHQERTYVITGKPASGKSTCISRLIELLQSRFRFSPTVIAIDVIIRRLHDSGQLLGNSTRESDGSIILTNFDQITQLCLMEMLDEMRQAKGNIIVEIPVIDAVKFPAVLELVARAHVLHLDAPTDIRSTRNKQRSGSRVSDNAVIWALSLADENETTYKDNARTLDKIPTDQSFAITLNELDCWFERCLLIP